MRKKILNLVLILMLVSAMFVLTGCGEEETTEIEETTEQTSSVDIVELVNQKIEEEGLEFVENEAVESYCNEVDSEIILDDVTGLLSVAVQDFDNDGTQEAVFVEIDDQAEISLDLYSINDNEELELSDTYEVSNTDFVYSDFIEFSIFAKEVDGKINLYIESSGGAGLFADGATWIFVGVEIENNKFVEAANESYSGSMISEDDEEEIITALNDSGFDVDSFNFYKAEIVFQVDDIVELCTISREHTDEYSYLRTSLLNGTREQEENLRYGYTLYYNYIDTQDYNLDMKKAKSLGISDVANEYARTLDSEYESIILDEDGNVSKGIYVIDSGTYEIIGNRIIATYTSEEDDMGEVTDIDVTEYYRIDDDKLISEYTVYEVLE